MKKLLLLPALLLLTTLLSYGQEDTIYSIAYSSTQWRDFNLNDRDTGNYFYIDPTPGNAWQIGTPSKTLFSSAHSVPLALVTDTLNPYPSGNLSSFTFTVYTDDFTRIGFWYAINSDSLDDGGVVEYSTDGGLTWTNIVNSSDLFPFNFYSSAMTIASNSNQPGFTGTMGFNYATIEGMALNYVKFRFTFSSDNVNTNKDGWLIDDFYVNCLGTGINEIGQNAPFRVYPNPASDHVVAIASDNQTKINFVEIRNSLGQCLVHTSNTRIDLSQLATGLYFVELNTAKGRYGYKLLHN